MYDIGAIRVGQRESDEPARLANRAADSTTKPRQSPVQMIASHALQSRETAVSPPFAPTGNTQQREAAVIPIASQVMPVLTGRLRSQSRRYAKMPTTKALVYCAAWAGSTGRIPSNATHWSIGNATRAKR
jgi:hypothetical protein